MAATLYTDELASEICRRLAEGESLRGICRGEGMPSHSTVVIWALEDVHGFGNRYARAREVQAHVLVDELVEIADKPMVGEKVTIKADGSREVVTGDTVDRARLRYDARKWAASKILPKIYGDRTVIAGDPAAPLVVEDNRRPIAELIAAALPSKPDDPAA